MEGRTRTTKPNIDGITQVGFHALQPAEKRRKTTEDHPLLDLHSESSSLGGNTPKPAERKSNNGKTKKHKRKKKKDGGTPKKTEAEWSEELREGFRRLRQERAEFEKEKSKFNLERSGLQGELSDLRFQVKDLECMKKTMEKDREKIYKEFQIQSQKLMMAKKELTRFVQQLTKNERKLQMEKLERNNKVVGRIGLDDPLLCRGSERIWIEGEMFQELAREQKRVESEKRLIDQKKRDLRAEVRSNRRSKEQDSSSGGTDSPFRKPHEPVVDRFAIRNEILKIQSDRLKGKQNSLTEQKVELKRKKTLHIKFLDLLDGQSRSSFRDMRVLANRFVLTNMLGRGGFSEVWKGYDLMHYRWVAVKIHQLSEKWDDEKKKNYTRHAKREYEIHKSLSHPRIVQFYDIIGIDSTTFCTILQFCKGTDLDTYLKINHHIKENEARCLISQVLSGLQYLNEQEQPIIHYDLKPANLLIENGEAKITDFGLSKMVDPEHPSMKTMQEIELTTPGAGTYWYLPPECFNGARISNRVDMWAVGIIFYQMLFGERPLGNDMSQKEIFSKPRILSSEISFPTSIRVSEDAKKFIMECLSINPRDRPDPLTVLKTHAYFAKIRK